MRISSTLLLFLVPSIVPAAYDSEPYVIELAGWCYDGGTIGVSLTDARGYPVEFCFDHRAWLLLRELRGRADRQSSNIDPISGRRPASSGR